MAIDIQKLQDYYNDDMILISDHAAMRCKQRGIKIKDIRNAVNNGEIIEQYPDDYPFPSCLILGKTYSNEWLHVVMSDEGSMSRIITAYYPDKEKWNDVFLTPLFKLVKIYKKHISLKHLDSPYRWKSMLKQK